jgi:hypothetical protein
VYVDDVVGLGLAVVVVEGIVGTGRRKRLLGVRAGLGHELAAAVVAIAQAAQRRLPSFAPRQTGDLVRVVVDVDRLYLVGQRGGGEPVGVVVGEGHRLGALGDTQQTVGIVVAVLHLGLRGGLHVRAPAGHVVGVVDRALRTVGLSHRIEVVVSPSQRARNAIDQTGQAVAGIIGGSQGTPTSGEGRGGQPSQRVVGVAGHAVAPVGVGLDPVHGVVGPFLDLAQRIGLGNPPVARRRYRSPHCHGAAEPR